MNLNDFEKWMEEHKQLEFRPLTHEELEFLEDMLSLDLETIGSDPIEHNNFIEESLYVKAVKKQRKNARIDAQRRKIFKLIIGGK